MTPDEAVRAALEAALAEVARLRDERRSYEAALSRGHAAEVALSRVRALHLREWAGRGPDLGANQGAYCTHCSDLKRDYVPWPCPTCAALDGAS